MKVFLVHGMGRSPASLFLMGRRFGRAGFEAHGFGYSVSRQGLSSIVSRFVESVAAAVRAGEPYGIVGHSLGNVIARAASPRLPAGLSRIVMLAPPNRPALLARKFGRNPLFRLLTGDAGQSLGDPGFFANLPIPTVPTLVVAGTGWPRLRWHPHGDEPSDGVVSVAETQLPGAEHREVPCLHTFIMNDAEVTRLATTFLGR